MKNKPDENNAAAEIIRPRLIDHYGILGTQNSFDFAIPFLHEDIPLYVDPFLMWKSPSQQDQSLHDTLINAFNAFGREANSGNMTQCVERLCRISECNEVGLGNSANRTGKRIGKGKALEILGLFERLLTMPN